MRGRNRDQAGAGAIGCIFMVLLVAGAIHAGVQLGMPRLRHNSFQDRMNETFIFFSRQPEKVIRERIISMASEFDIALKPEQVKIEIVADRLTIDIAYEKVADFKVWSTTLPFTMRRSGPY